MINITSTIPIIFDNISSFVLIRIFAPIIDPKTPIIVKGNIKFQTTLLCLI